MIMMKCKKKSLFLLFTAVFICIAIAACIFFIPPLSKRLEKRETTSSAPATKPPVEKLTDNSACSTADCVIEAAKIIKYMNEDADPCEDFYNYACGEFMQTQSIPEGWESYRTQDIHNEELDITVKSVLEAPDKVNQSDSLTKAKIVYRTCLDLSYIERVGILDLRDVLSSTGVGDWPFLNSDWKDCRLDIEWRMARMNALGLDSLFHFETKFSGEDNKLHAVLRPAEPLVEGICDDDPDNVTIALEKASEHRKVLESVLTLLGVTITNVTDLDIDDLFEFDFYLCNATKEYRLKGPVEDIETLSTTLLNLADMAPQINWMRWRNLIFSELHLNFPHDKQHIYIDGLQSSIFGINDLLRKSTSKVQANYLTWRFVLQHLGFLGEEFRKILYSHYELLAPKLGNLMMGSVRSLSRWRQCVIYVKDLMPLSILLDYSERIQMEDREKEMDNITSLINDEFKMIMKDARDLSKRDQMISSHKLSILQFLLTYPYKERKFFGNFYMDAGNMDDSFLKNGLKLRRNRMKKLLEGVSRGKTVYDIEYTIQTIHSAFGSEMYSFFRGNQIVVSLGALQSCPLKNRPLPKFMTLSTFGWRIGHELAHGFDLFAVDGSTGQNWTYWSPSVSRSVEDKATCYLQYYPHENDLTIKKALKTTSLNEDICDNEALLLAHRAYLRYLSNHVDQNLIGLQLSNKELFFVTYAQQFCELRRSTDSSSPISPGRRRVNQVLQNYGPFSTTFGCSRDKPMNEPKCASIWS